MQVRPHPRTLQVVPGQAPVPVGNQEREERPLASPMSWYVCVCVCVCVCPQINPDEPIPDNLLGIVGGARSKARSQEAEALTSGVAPSLEGG